MKGKKTIVEVQVLLEHLKALREVARNELLTEIPIVVFHQNMIVARNNSCFYARPFKHPLKECVLPFTPLVEFLSRFPEGKPITFWQDGKKIKFHYQLRKGTRKTTTSFAMLEYNASYTAEEKPERGFKKVPDDFSTGLQYCLSILPTDSLRYDLTLIRVQNKTIVSSDDSRVFMYTMSKPVGSKAFYLSKINSNIIVNSDFSQYYAKGGSIYFKSNTGWASFALQADVTYPDINPAMFKTDSNKSVLALKTPMKTILERTLLFAEGKTDIAKVCQFEVADGQYCFRARNDVGKSVEKSPIKEGNFEGSVHLNPFYLHQILAHIPNSKVLFNFEQFHTGYKIIIKFGQLDMLMATYHQ